MLESDRFALAARMHVLLRRTTGRVTDTEWLAKNAEYATEIVRFARQSAQEMNHLELLSLADKFEVTIGLSVPGKEVRRSIFSSGIDKPDTSQEMKPSGRYVGGLR
jgi:hypothetical protein